MTPLLQSEIYSWPLRLGQFIIVLFYFAAGFAKVSRSGWQWAWSETVAFRILESAQGSALAEWLLTQHPFLIRGLASTALAFEFLAPLALLGRRWSLFFVAAWTSLHIGIYFSMDGHGTFFSLLWCFIFFLAPAFSQKLARFSRP